MPHFSIEYSANLEPLLDMAGLCEVIRAAAAELDTFPMAGIRVRALRAEHYAIADGNPAHGFIDISIRLREGRPDEIKRDATQHIFDAAHAFLEAAMAEYPIALSLEMRDIDAALSPKTGSIRAFLDNQET